MTLAVDCESPRDAAALHAARLDALAARCAPPDTAERTTVDDPCDPIAADDPDECTIDDPIAPDEEPTTIRPTPIPPELALAPAADGDTHRDRSAPRAAGSGSGRARKLGKYEVHGPLASGAFGVIYAARDPSLDRRVAIKVLRPSHLGNHDVLQRFLQEARTAARIAHPGIVTIHDCGMVQTPRGPTAFIAMELLSGESLGTRLERRGRLAPADACEIARQVASALEAAHHARVLHRDLKPDNIFVVPDPAMPSGERVKLLDFGLAKLGATELTQLESVFGTPRYMSPEQGRSATQIDPRSDIYALGCVLFELVTGTTPFDGGIREVLALHQSAAPPRAASRTPDISPALDELIADMLAKDPLDRPQTMAAVQRLLRREVDALGEPAVAAAPPGPTAASSAVTPAPGAEHPLPPCVRRAAPSPGRPVTAPPPSVDAGMSGEVVVPPVTVGHARAAPVANLSPPSVFPDAPADLRRYALIALALLAAGLGIGAAVAIAAIL